LGRVFMTIIIHILARLVYPSQRPPPTFCWYWRCLTLLFERAAAERVGAVADHAVSA
jgi:hypothetical protein